MKRFFRCAAALLLLVCLLGITPRARALNRYLRVGLNPNTPPFQFQQADGTCAGMHVDMLTAIAEPRKELADSAPKMIQMKINPDKIREVIGSGGKVIQKICADTGCKIDIEDDGSIFIASEDIEACRAARQTIENIVFEPEVGELYYGKVSNIRSEFGAWVELAPGKDGLVKIKDLEFKRTEKVEDVLKIGDMTWVKVMNVDDRGRIDLSRKDAMREKGLM